MFRSLLAPVEGSLSKVAKEHESRIACISRHTLGQAVQNFRQMVSENQHPTRETPDLFEPWVSTSFEFVLDREAAERHCAELSKLANERNNLIHHELAGVDFNSREQCVEIIEKLEVQNARVLEQLDVFAALVREVQSALAESQKFMDSNEFLNQFLVTSENDA